MPADKAVAAILSTESVIIWNSKPKSSAATSCFSIYDHPGRPLLLMHTFINWTAVSLLGPPSSTSKQTMIYNSHDLRSTGVPKYHRLLSRSFIHAPSTDKVKLDVDALDDFIQNLLMCLLCTINLKPLGVSEQSVASAALLLLGKMISCFVNCRDSDTCILMVHFGCRCILINAKWIIAECFVAKPKRQLGDGYFTFRTETDRYIRVTVVQYFCVMTCLNTSFVLKR